MKGTAILIPILTSHFYIGDFYNGRKITSIPYLRYVTNKDTDGGSIWATIMKKGYKATRIVSDLKNIDLNLHYIYFQYLEIVN